MAPWATIVIPTRDSAAWIGALLDHYRARGIVPMLLLDSRTGDGTRAIAARAGAPVTEISGFTFTEAIVRVTRDCVRTPWALFMHDDEAPSDALFARLAGPPPPDEVQSVAIPRRWAWHSPGEPLRYGRSDHWQDRTGQPGTDHAWRLFRPDRVTFVPAMHTEGFLIDRWSRLPLDTYFVHFEWVIRTHAQRAAKLRGYDRHRDGYGRFFENMYLPESQPDGLVEYLDFGTDEFDLLAAIYHRARKPASDIPRRTLREQLSRARSRIAAGLGLVDLSAEPGDRAGLTPRLDLELPDTAPIRVSFIDVAKGRAGPV